MPQLSHERYKELVALGHRPIDCPAELWHSGNITLQKMPGAHQIEKYRKTGSFNDPLVQEKWIRKYKEAAKSLVKGTMSPISLKKFGGVEGLLAKCKEFGIVLKEESLEMAKINGAATEETLSAIMAGRADATIEAEAVNEKLVEAELKRSIAEAAASKSSDTRLNIRKDDFSVAEEISDNSQTPQAATAGEDVFVNVPSDTIEQI